MSMYRKFGVMVLAIIGATIAALVPALSDNVVDAGEWLNVVILTAGAASVLRAPNVPGAKYTKVALAVITAVATLATSLITDGFTSAELLQLLLAGMAAAGVYGLPNAGDMLDRSVGGTPELRY